MASVTAELTTLTQAQLDELVGLAKLRAHCGRLPDYIPCLAQADPNWVAVQVQCLNGTTYRAGESDQPVALMSVVKPLLLLFLLAQQGSEVVFGQVGMEPSDQSFHSLAQLKADRGFPRNPMLNSGAIALTALLPGKHAADRCETLRQWLNHQSGSHLVLDELMLASVRSLENEVNRAIAQILAESGALDAIDLALDTYNHLCCLSGTVDDLAKLGALLAGDAPGRRRTKDQKSQHLAPGILRTVNALMLTCGLYETSGAFAVRIGLPIKSGVSGALLAVVPRQGAIACYSPNLDAAGHSVAGLFLVEQLTQTLGLSLFGGKDKS